MSDIVFVKFIIKSFISSFITFFIVYFMLQLAPINIRHKNEKKSKATVIAIIKKSAKISYWATIGAHVGPIIFLLPNAEQIITAILLGIFELFYRIVVQITLFATLKFLIEAMRR